MFSIINPDIKPRAPQGRLKVSGKAYLDVILTFLTDKILANINAYVISKDRESFSFSTLLLLKEFRSFNEGRI